MSEEEKKEIKALEIILDTRKFEIGLFWNRSLFFWGFITLAFAFYGYAKKELSQGVIPLGAASFGLICSWCWHLVNRGSKYWQENWEQKVEDLEEKVTGQKLFFERERRLDKGFWSAWTYSVGKLTLFMSLFVFFIWIMIFTNETVLLLAKPMGWNIGKSGWLCFKSVTIILFTSAMFLFSTFWTATSGEERNHKYLCKKMWWQKKKEKCADLSETESLQKSQ